MLAHLTWSRSVEKQEREMVAYPPLSTAILAEKRGMLAVLTLPRSIWQVKRIQVP